MISIIIPSYNSASTIVEALESVLAQTVWARNTTDHRPQTAEPIGCEALGGRGSSEPQRQDGSREVRPSGKPAVSPAYEVIIVDDGSTDDTVEVVEEWLMVHGLCNTGEEGEEWFMVHGLASQKSEVGIQNPEGGIGSPGSRRRELSSTISHQPFPINRFPSTIHHGCSWHILRMERNMGPAAARNAGIAAARGEWIAFLDADDVWYPDKMECQARLAAEHPEVVLWAGGLLRFADGKPPERRIALEVPTGALKTITLEELAWHNPVKTSTVMIRKSVLEDAGGFDTQFRGPEDYDLWLRVTALAQRIGTRIVVADRILIQYRQTVGSLSMDERTFLPQALKVIEKAFRPGGVLAEHQYLRSRAMSTQYWGGALTAFSRGDRVAAIRLWVKGWRLNRRATPPVGRPWFKMLIRYCCLAKPGMRRGV